MSPFLTYLIILGVSIFGGLILLLTAGTILWNRNLRPHLLKLSRPTDKFGRIMSRTMRFMTREDTGSIFAKKPKKGKDGKEKPAPPLPPILETITYRKLYLALVLLFLAMAIYAYTDLAKLVFAFVPLLLGVLILATRATPVFRARHKVLTKMFSVSTQNFRYGSDATSDPWSYVQIQKWSGKTTPSLVQVHIPDSFRGDSRAQQESFERHFDTTVSSDFEWTYDWDFPNNNVVCTMVPPLPDMVPYPGSEDYPWYRIPLGIGHRGPVYVDFLAEDPHSLIAGPSGSGKSVLQRSFIFHCIQHNDEIVFVGIDLKRVELSPYEKYSTTIKAIATELEDAVELLRQLHDTMDERYKLMKERGVQNVADLKDERGRPPKSIFLMVDETFALLAPGGAKSDKGKADDILKGEASSLIGSLLRLARAAGIFLLLATQRNDATVITGEMKNNMQNRIAAGRMDSTPSSMLMDGPWAAQLPRIRGRGVMRSASGVNQFQGYFAKPEWIDQWLDKHPEREPQLYGLPVPEQSAEEDALDRIDEHELDFEMDEKAEQMLLASDSHREEPDLAGFLDGDLLDEATLVEQEVAPAPRPRRVSVPQAAPEPVAESEPVLARVQAPVTPPAPVSAPVATPAPIQTPVRPQRPVAPPVAAPAVPATPSIPRPQQAPIPRPQRPIPPQIPVPVSPMQQPVAVPSTQSAAPVRKAFPGLG